MTENNPQSILKEIDHLTNIIDLKKKEWNDKTKEIQDIEKYKNQYGNFNRWQLYKDFPEKLEKLKTDLNIIAEEWKMAFHNRYNLEQLFQQKDFSRK